VRHVSLVEIDCSYHMTNKIINEIHRTLNEDKSSRGKLHIISRAVDDNWWLESNKTSSSDIQIQITRKE